MRFAKTSQISPTTSSEGTFRSTTVRGHRNPEVYRRKSRALRNMAGLAVPVSAKGQDAFDLVLNFHRATITGAHRNVQPFLGAMGRPS